MSTHALLQNYYRAFNEQDLTTFLSLLTDDVIHDINQGAAQIGKAQFTTFWQQMAKCYKEEISNIRLLVSPDSKHAAAEYLVTGQYIASDAGLPTACGQKYALPGGAFFDIKDGKIARISNYYNLNDWLAQINANK